MDLVRHDKSTPFETKSRYYRATEIVVPNLIQPAKLNTNVVLLPCLILELVRQGSSATFGTGLGIIYSALLLFFHFLIRYAGPFTHLVRFSRHRCLIYSILQLKAKYSSQTSRCYPKISTL